MNQQSLYELIGGADGWRKITDRFYELMDTLPEAKEIREMHPADLTSSREKLFEFFSGWSGGPPLFVEKYGHPRLRMRHMPFAIGERERDQWMLCMRQTLEECISDETLRSKLEGQLMHIADFMRNQ